jgi:hypothetical protein
LTLSFRPATGEVNAISLGFPLLDPVLPFFQFLRTISFVWLTPFIDE